MNKCLVTKLKGIVNNDSLMKMNELAVHVNRVETPEFGSQFLRITNTDTCSLRIVGDGNFTDQNLVENKGNVLQVGNTLSTVFFSNGDYDIYLNNKYSITIANFINCTIDLDDFKYLSLLSQLSCNRASGSLKSISNISTLKTLEIYDARNVYGTFADIPKSINSLHIGGLPGIQNIEDLKFYTGSSLAIQNGTIIGDAAILNNNVSFISFGAEHNANLSWSNRNEEGYIIALEGSPRFINLDAMLNNQANCRAISRDGQGANKFIISARGTRTSASDAAVQTLQSKGYTVIIKPA